MNKTVEWHKMKKRDARSSVKKQPNSPTTSPFDELDEALRQAVLMYWDAIDQMLMNPSAPSHKWPAPASGIVVRYRPGTADFAPRWYVTPDAKQFSYQEMPVLGPEVLPQPFRITVQLLLEKHLLKGSVAVIPSTRQVLVPKPDSMHEVAHQVHHLQQQMESIVQDLGLS